jgi:hypothetical protein
MAMYLMSSSFLDLGTRGYTQLYFLAPPCKRNIHFTMATHFAFYRYKGLE